MALQIWLPLNGNLDNQGLSNVTVTNNGATVNNSGKIGKCYSFDGSDDYMTILYDKISGTNVFSICFWAYCNSGQGYYPVFCVNKETPSATNGITLHGIMNRLEGGDGTNKFDQSAGATITNSWVHKAVTYDGSNIKKYTNGVLDQTISWTHGFGNNGYIYIGKFWSSAKFNGYLNDFRVYDHALSPREIAEIAKGLVVHYPLSGIGQENLYTGSRDFSGTWVNQNYWTTDSELYNGFVVKKKSTKWGGLAQNVTATNGDIFTISFYAKVESGGNIQSVRRSNLGNVTTGLSLLGGNFISGNIWVNNNDNATNWKYYWATVQITSADITYLQWSLENSVSGKMLYIAGIKLEKGSIPTPWTPNSADTLYSVIGLNDNIEYDVSGYNNHGSKIGTFSASSDTARYTSSTVFNGSSTYIEADSLPAETKSVSFWMKPVNSGNNYVVFADYNSQLCFGLESNDHFNTMTTSARGTTFAKSAIVQDVWNHVVVIKTGDTTRKLYVNGIEQTGVSTNFWTHNVDCLLIGRRKTVDTTLNHVYFSGQLSDFRAYATQLTEAQIIDLYQTPISLSRDGTLFATEFVEG